MPFLETNATFSTCLCL